jgi:hypothetical protein
VPHRKDGGVLLSRGSQVRVLPGALVLGTCCVVVTVLSLVHPGWNAYLQPYLTAPIGADRGNAGGGVGFIVLPLVLVGVLAHRLWWRARVELEAHRRRS